LPNIDYTTESVSLILSSKFIAWLIPPFFSSTLSLLPRACLPLIT